MSDKSNNQGRAYEFACLLTLKEEIEKHRSVEIEKVEGYSSSKEAWNTLDNTNKNLYKKKCFGWCNGYF